MKNIEINLLKFEYPREALFTVSEVSYGGEEQLYALRKELAGRCVVKRREELLTIFPTRPDVALSGKEIRREAHPSEITSLLKEWLISHFSSQDRVVLVSRRALSILSTQKEDDLWNALYGGLTLSGIELNLAYKLAIQTKSPDGESTPYIAVDTSVLVRFKNEIQTLLDLGIDLKGLYVSRSNEPYDNRVELKGRLTGKITEVQGEYLYLDDIDPRYQESKIHFKDARLEARLETLAVIISRFRRESSADKELERIRDVIGRKSVGPAKLKKLTRLCSYFKRLGRIEIAPGVCGLLLPFNQFRKSFRMEKLQRTNFIFDPGGIRIASWHQRGLDNHGPFDRDSFSPKKLNIAVVCQARHQGRTEEFVEHFLNGVPHHRSHVGFIRRFSLEKPYVQVFSCDDETSKSYKETCLKAIQHIADRGERWNLALIQINKKMEALSGNQNPYFVTKAFFLSRDIAVQHFHLRTAKQSLYNRGYTLNDMGLATYAKLGGIPWLLPVTNKLAHELLFGLGSYHEKDSRFGASTRYVGITTVFSGDGRYLFENRTKAVPFESYQRELSRITLEAIRQRQQEQAWHPDDPVRLIFHAFKPLKDAEALAIRDAVENLSLTRVEYAFVHVIEAHPFQVFDHNQNGQPAGNQKKGINAPFRGLKTELSQTEAVLCLKGPNELKKPTDGHPKPVVLRLHRFSTFTDLTYLSQQAYSLSSHSWRTFFPAPLPVTILYSELIAEGLRNLSGVERWSEDDLAGRTGRTRWFL